MLLTILLSDCEFVYLGVRFGWPERKARYAYDVMSGLTEFYLVIADDPICTPERIWGATKYIMEFQIRPSNF